MTKLKSFFSIFLLTIGSIIGFASAAHAKNIECSVNLVQVKKSSSWGIGGESKDAEVVLLKKPNGNFAGSSNVGFSKIGNIAYKVSLQFAVGDSNLTSTWSSITVALYKEEAGNNKLLGSVLIPNAYYKEGSIAPQEIWIGNNESLDKISNEPGAFNFENLDLAKLAIKFADGEVVGAMLACTPK